MKVLVTVGTHHQPFDRLVRAAAALQRAGHEVVAQVGTSTVEVAGGRALLTPSELAAAARAADVVVCHAAPASVWLAWDAGKVPIVVPRRAAAGEHVDDHQALWAEALVDGVVVVSDPDALVAGWDALVARTRRQPPPADGGASSFCEGLGVAVDDAVRASRGRARRATVERLASWMRRWT